MTFIQQLVKESEAAPYPKDVDREPGSMTLRYGAATLVLDVDSTSVYLSNLHVPKKATGTGAGSKALVWLCKLADKWCVPIKLTVTGYSHRTLNDAELTLWYRRHGFVKRRGSQSEMIRRPR